MKRYKFGILLLAATVLLCFSAGCGAKASLTGKWECISELSVIGLGVDISEQGSQNCTVRFSFREDGNGTMDLEVHGDFPPSGSRTFQYNTDGDQLTLKYDGGNSEHYTFVLKGNTLVLNGRASLELTKQSN